MSKITRRRFVQSSAVAAGAAFALSPLSKVRGANNDIRLGFIGLGGRGSYSVKWFAGLKDIRVAALCDVDSTHLAKNAEKFPAAKKYTDLRKVLDDKDIDAVVISTPNHWHSLAGIWACEAGKDVYVEKPISHDMHEGRQLVEAGHKHNRIVQGGTQQRSDPVQAKIKAYLAEGHIGKIQWVRGNRYGIRESIGKRSTPLTPPPEVDYNLWLGPAQDLPIYRDHLHYDWHWEWNTGNGEMGNWGVHILDDIRNVPLGDKCSLPKRVLAGGGRLVWNDAGETPNVHFVYYDTGIVPVLFDLSNLPVAKGRKASPNYRGVRSGYVIQCEGGYYAGGRGGGTVFDNNGKRIARLSGDGGRDHNRNFIDCVRSRKRSDLHAEIEKTHYSTGWCNLANMAYQLGHGYTKQQAMEMAADFKPWGELLDGFEAHLEAIGVNVAKSDLRLSAPLEFDPEKETFTGPSATPAAMKLLRREYRKGFELPNPV